MGSDTVYTTTKKLLAEIEGGRDDIIETNNVEEYKMYNELILKGKGLRRFDNPILTAVRYSSSNKILQYILNNGGSLDSDEYYNIFDFIIERLVIVFNHHSDLEPEERQRLVFQPDVDQLMETMEMLVLMTNVFKPSNEEIQTGYGSANLLDLQKKFIIDSLEYTDKVALYLLNNVSYDSKTHQEILELIHEKYPDVIEI